MRRKYGRIEGESWRHGGKAFRKRDLFVVYAGTDYELDGGTTRFSIEIAGLTIEWLTAIRILNDTFSRDGFEITPADADADIVGR